MKDPMVGVLSKLNFWTKNDFSDSVFQDNFFRKLMIESLQQRLREVMTECSVKETFDI